MKPKLLEKFLNKKCKIRLKTGFNLTGTIDAIHEDSITFTTNQGTSVINTDGMASVLMVKGDELWVTGD